MIPTDPRFSADKTGPNTAPGRTVVNSVLPSELLMKSQAARSASILDTRYASNCGSAGSDQTVSSLTPPELRGGRAAAAADVITTRLTPAFTAARSTRSVPSRAGPMNEILSPGAALAPPSGDAT